MRCRVLGGAAFVTALAAREILGVPIMPTTIRSSHWRSRPSTRGTMASGEPWAARHQPTYGSAPNHISVIQFTRSSSRPDYAYVLLRTLDEGFWSFFPPSSIEAMRSTSIGVRPL